jgi:hypothetical protein
MARAIAYKAALAWIVDNDDTGWLDDDEPIISTTAMLVADIYDKAPEIVIADLLTLNARSRK